MKPMTTISFPTGEYKLVPVEPTVSMLDVGEQARKTECRPWPANNVYAAMLAAVPDQFPGVVVHEGEPVAWAVVSVKGGINKLSITKESADNKAAKLKVEWPNNGCRVEPLYNHPAPSQPANMEVAKLIADIRSSKTLAMRDSLFEQLICALEAGYCKSQPEAFHLRVNHWLMECFGQMIAGDREERNHRFFEESTELVQACGMSRSEAHQLVDYVYDRPVGEPHQEVGGVMVTLAALCLANDLDMHQCGETELARIWTKVEQIRAKQAAKPKHSPLPESTSQPSAEALVQAALEAAADACETAEVPIDADVWLGGTKKQLSSATAIGLSSIIRTLSAQQIIESCKGGKS